MVSSTAWPPPSAAAFAASLAIRFDSIFAAIFSFCAAAAASNFSSFIVDRTTGGSSAAAAAAAAPSVSVSGATTASTAVPAPPPRPPSPPSAAEAAAATEGSTDGWSGGPGGLGAEAGTGAPSAIFCVRPCVRTLYVRCDLQSQTHPLQMTRTVVEKKEKRKEKRKVV